MSHPEFEPLLPFRTPPGRRCSAHFSIAAAVPRPHRLAGFCLGITGYPTIKKTAMRRTLLVGGGQNRV